MCLCFSGGQHVLTYIIAFTQRPDAACSRYVCPITLVLESRWVTAVQHGRGTVGRR